MQDPVQAIKDRLGIVELVRQYVDLKKAGRNFKGLCPFHQEDTPSFVVSPEKGIAYCFGCNQGGDIFNFYQLVEQVDFPEAIRRLGQQVGIEVQQKIDTAEAKERKQLQHSLVDVHELAVRYYEEQLWKTDAGQKVVTYLKGRGLTDELIKQFKIGYADVEDSSLLAELRHADVAGEVMVQSGLIVAQDTAGRQLVDRFKQRLMIPIHDVREQPIAFGGRALKKEQMPKYLNSPDTPIYHKQEILFGFAQAKQHIRQVRQVFLVEGYFDVFAFWLAGVPRAVATCGTALTEKHVKLLKRFCDQAVLAFDHDKAGQAAAWRAAELLLAADVELKVLYWQDGKDPADVAAENPQLLKELTETQVISFWDYLWRTKLENGAGLQKPSLVKELVEDLTKLLSVVPNPVVQDVYVRKVSQLLQVRPERFYQALQSEMEQKKRWQPSSKNEQAVKKETAEAFKMTAEALFWAQLAMRPQLFVGLADLIMENADLFELKAIYKAFVGAYNDARIAEVASYTELDLSEEAHKLLNKLVLYLEAHSSDIRTDKQITEELKALLQRIIQAGYRQRLERLQLAIQAAEAKSDQVKVEQLLQEYTALLK